MRILNLAFALVSTVFSAVTDKAQAVDYPYSNVGSQSASLSINSFGKTPFNNRLLGLNTNFPENLYGLDGYNDADGQGLITGWSPPSLRFPHGVWSNFYDWEVDGRRIYDGYMGTYYNAVVDVPQLKYGYDGFKTLHDNLGFDVLHTWNINYDSPEKGVARLQDRRADGFDVSRIELGNETFWVNQRSEAVATPELYVGVAQAHSAALKAVDPTIQLSVPVSWRTTGHHVPWNAALAADQTYYDAVTLHKYIRPGDSTAGLEEVLAARSQIIQTAEATRAQFAGKPIWLSEWSVDAGENAISVLGLSDTYLGIIDRPDLFASAEYFQIHNHDPLVIYDKNANPKHVKTTRGAAYDIIRSVFIDSELLSGQVTTSEIVPGLESTSAKAVVKGDDLLVYAVNKSPVSVPFSLDIDSNSYSGAYTHEALQFNDINDFPTFNLADSGLSPITSTPGAISLPPLSISVLTISNPPIAEPGTLIAGWDTWNSASAPMASFTASGVTGSAVTTSEGLAWHANDGRGASADGDWGTFAGPPAASTVAGDIVTGENLELSNATTGGTITFTLTNNGTSDIELDAFHFDAYAFRPKAARAYELSVSGGDLTNGVIYSSADDEIAHVSGAWDNLAHDDIDHSLAGLDDNVLGVGESVDFLIAFSSGEGDGSGGHDLWIDNVAITGSILGLSGDFDSDGYVDGTDFLQWQTSDGTASGLTEWQGNYGASASQASASATIPEPNTLLLLVLGLSVPRCRLHRSVD